MKALVIFRITAAAVAFAVLAIQSCVVPQAAQAQGSLAGELMSTVPIKTGPCGSGDLHILNGSVPTSTISMSSVLVVSSTTVNIQYPTSQSAAFDPLGAISAGSGQWTGKVATMYFTGLQSCTDLMMNQVKVSHYLNQSVYGTASAVLTSTSSMQNMHNLVGGQQSVAPYKVTVVSGANQHVRQSPTTGMASFQPVVLTIAEESGAPPPGGQGAQLIFACTGPAQVTCGADESRPAAGGNLIISSGLPSQATIQHIVTAGAGPFLMSVTGMTLLSELQVTPTTVALYVDPTVSAVSISSGNNVTAKRRSMEPSAMASFSGTVTLTGIGDHVVPNMPVTFACEPATACAFGNTVPGPTTQAATTSTQGTAAFQLVTNKDGPIKVTATYKDAYGTLGATFNLNVMTPCDSYGLAHHLC
jgi:hypothetical protein